MHHAQKELIELSQMVVEFFRMRNEYFSTKARDLRHALRRQEVRMLRMARDITEQSSGGSVGFSSGAGAAQRRDF